MRRARCARASCGGPSLPAGARVDGPAVIEEPNATTLIHPGDVATVSDAGHLVIDVALDQGGRS